MINQSAKQFDQAGSRIAADFRAMIADSEDLLKAAATVSGEGLAAARVKFEDRVSRARTALAEARTAHRKSASAQRILDQLEAWTFEIGLDQSGQASGHGPGI